jgi:hypothetical protein
MPWRRKPAHWLEYWEGPIKRDAGFKTILVFCLGPADLQSYHERCHHNGRLRLGDLPDWDWYDITAHLRCRNAVRWASSTPGWIGPRLSISTRAFADARTHCRPHLALSRCTSSSMSVCRQIGSRHIAMLTFCLACAACSGMHDMPEEPNPAPDVKKAIPSVKAVAAQYHLTGQLEIAGPIEAPIMSSVRWVICLRAASAPQQTHTLFFKADTNVSSRISTLGDHCDAQSYRPLPN